MPKKPKVPKVSTVSSLEAGYSLAFGLILWWYFAGTVPANWWHFGMPSVSNSIIAAFVSFQLLRMYYYLHRFEQEISIPGTNHFLECLEPRSSYWERAMRFGLAGILVLIPKLDQHTTSSIGIPFTPALWLSCCFGLLLWWDRIIWQGIDPKLISGRARTSFQAFFYLNDQLRGRSLKRAERISGLLAAMAAVASLAPNIQEDNLWLTVSFTFLIVFFLIYLFFPLLANHWMQKPWEVSDAYLKALRIYAVEPVYTVATYLKPGGPNMPRKKAYGIMLALVGCLTLLHNGCSRDADPPPSSSSSSASYPARSVQMRIATSKNLWCTLTLVAEAKGYFREEGLAPQMNYQAAGRLNMDALLGGAADFANVVETNIAYQALNRTSNLAILGKIVSAPDYAILTKAGAGIREPGDLRGKRLAYAQATGAESFVFWFLEKEKIPARSLTLVRLQPAGLVDHFIGESTEAVATWEPFVTTIRGRISNLGPTFQTDSTGFAGTMTVATLRDYAHAHLPIVNAYERAMEKAARFVADNPADAQRIMAEQAGLPLETVRSIWPRFDFRYSRSSSEDAALVRDVVRRIKTNLPDMAKREPADVQSYFAPVR